MIKIGSEGEEDRRTFGERCSLGGRVGDGSGGGGPVDLLWPRRGGSHRRSNQVCLGRTRGMSWAFIFSRWSFSISWISPYTYTYTYLVSMSKSRLLKLKRYLFFLSSFTCEKESFNSVFLIIYVEGLYCLFTK